MIYQQKVDFQAHYLPKVYYDFLEEEGLYSPQLHQNEIPETAMVSGIFLLAATV